MFKHRSDYSKPETGNKIWREPSLGHLRVQTGSRSLSVCFKTITMDYISIIAKRWGRTSSWETTGSREGADGLEWEMKGFDTGIQNKAHLHDNCLTALTLSFLSYQKEQIPSSLSGFSEDKR